jgi:hypothetical protein
MSNTLLVELSVTDKFGHSLKHCNLHDVTVSPFIVYYLKTQTMTTFSSFKDQLTKRSAGIADMIKKNKKQSSDQQTVPQGNMPYPRKFEMVSEFVISMRDVLTISDRYHFGAPYLWYHSIRYIMKYAFIDYPVPGINYEKVLISRGDLWNTQKAIAKAVPNAITFTWTNDISIGGAKPDDKCILVAYCEVLNKFVFTSEGGERHSGEAKLVVPGFRSHKVHTWVGFISVDGTRIANSIYTGEITVT